MCGHFDGESRGGGVLKRLSVEGRLFIRGRGRKGDRRP